MIPRRSLNEKTALHGRARILAVFLDKSGHTDFMGRRQSSDRAAIDRLVKYASGRTIFIRPYSEPLFSDCPDAHTLICSDF